MINILVAFIAIEHIGFLILEMFLWTNPIGLKIFKLEPDFAIQSQALAANQGLYNGFLAAGLLWSLLHSEARFSISLKNFFLICICIAGLYGWYSISVTTFFLQTIPAALCLVILYFHKSKRP